MQGELSMPAGEVLSEGRNGDHTLNGHEPDLLKGIIVGAVAGLAATWVMTQFQNIWNEALADDSQGEDSEEEPSTVKVAETISDKVLHHDLQESEKESAGNAVHYGFGTLMGLLFSAVSEYKPGAAQGLGLPYGTALWAFNDNVALPALGLSKKPTEIPAKDHLYAFTSHLVYGLTADVVRRVLRRIW